MAVVQVGRSSRFPSISGLGAVKALGLGVLVVATIAVGVLAAASLTGAPELRIGAELGILALAAFGGFLLFVLGFRRMELFVITLLVVRSSLDVSRLNGDAQSQSLANPSSLAALMFLALGGTWILVRRAAGYRHPTSFLQRALILFLVAAALCVIGSNDPGISGLEFLRTAAAIVMFFVVDRLLENTDRPDRILKAVFASAAIPVFLGLVGPFIGLQLVEEKDNIERVTSTFVGANSFSFYLVFLSLMALGLALYASPRLRWPLVGLAAILGVTLILTFTRTAWIAFAAGALLLGAYAGKKVLGAMVLVLVVCVLFVPAIGDRFQELGSTNANNLDRRDSLEWRIAYWTDIIPLANSNPITGIGLKMTAEETDAAKLPHNDYLRSYVEMGVVGLVTFVVMLVAMIRTPMRSLRIATDGLQRGILVGFLAISVALAVASLADNLINQVVVLWYVFALGGCASWAARRAAQAAELSASSQSQPQPAPATV